MEENDAHDNNTILGVSLFTGGNVVRDDRTVMQMKSLRDNPDMSYRSSKQWK